MKVSEQAENILSRINSRTKLGDLRKMAKEIKKDHSLAMQLWASGQFLPRQLAILILDNKALSPDRVNELTRDIQGHPRAERTQLMDWLMANQLVKDKKTLQLIESWEESEFPLQRRIFWYYQARIRWVGQNPPENTGRLLSLIETRISKEDPDVQWAMNFTAGWIGVYDVAYRDRCIAIGEKTGLYKGDMVSKGCTPDYLPEFIKIESSKRGL